nr:MAG TPA: hypothetical protein [Caudoviricetes sp.]
MAGYTPSDEFAGFATNDDWVLAVGINLEEEAAEKDYTVVQMGIAGLDPQMNPVTQDKQYIRTGLSTSKTGTQRTFSITGDRYIGDAFQDYCFGLDIAHGVGQAVVVPYVYFSVLTGKGEKGQVSIIVNSDGGGNAGENSAISIDLRSVGTKPTAYSYSVGV